jgi:hypothetical protein
MPSETFTDDGQEVTWTVPGGVAEITIEAWGAAGGDGQINISGEDSDPAFLATGQGGLGSYVSGSVAVAGGDTVTMRIGEDGADGGWPDGGTGFTETRDESNPDQTITAEAGDGGGSTAVEVEGDELLRAGGGGGGGAAGMGTTDDATGGASVGSGGDANGGSGGDGSSDASFEFGSASASASGGSGSAGGEFAENGNTASVGESGQEQGAAASGPGGGGDSGGGAGGVDTDSGNVVVAAAAGSGGAGDEFIAGSVSNTSTQNGTTSPNNGTAGQVTISYVQPPDPPSDFSVTGEGRECSLTWTNDPDGYDEIKVYRATQSGGETAADYTLVDTLDGTAESYTDDDNGAGLLDGERYYYRLRPLAGGSSLGWSNEDDATTVIPAPENLTHPVVGDESAAYAWTATHNNGETRVEYRRANEGDDWTTYETVDHETETATVDGLLTGEQYEGRVVAQTDHAETEDI